jgi:mannose-1-phosphate guanylyltransferase
MAVVTADHLIGDPARFRATVAAALDMAETRDVLVTQGIVPNRPETGYGYIQAKDIARPVSEHEGIAAYEVAAFHEKPTPDAAAAFVSSGRYFWNSGMFFWRVSAFLAELDHARPELARATRAMADALSANDTKKAAAIFESLEDISIDYALMEKARRVVVVRADYPWDDVGAWTSLDRTREHDAQGNVAEGWPVLIDTRNSIVYNAAGPAAVAVSVIGMDNVVVVVSPDGVLVVPKDRAQDVRHAVAELKKRGANQV